MKTAKQLRAQARAALKGRYWWAFLASLIAGILGGTSGSSGSVGGAAGGSSASSSSTAAQGSVQLSPEALAALSIILGIAAIIAIAMLIVGSSVELGYNTFNIRLYETDEKPPLGMLFSRFSIFGKALGLRLLIMLKTFLWSLLFIVPGIIAAFRYAMAPYVLAENPELSASEAIERSKQLMAGNKWRLFCLGLSFIGWMLLGCLALGVGLLFIPPYYKAAETAFYLELTGKDPAAEAPPIEAAPEQV